MAEGKILEFPKKEDEVIANLNEVMGTQVSAKVLALIEVMLTAEMLHTYALHNIEQEVPGKADEVRAEVLRQLREMEEFNLSVVKFRLFDALQVVMTNIAELYLAASMKAESPVAEATAPAVPEVTA